MIPASVKIKNGELPDSPGVYFYYSKDGELLYIGKATSLKKRVGTYFTKAHNARIAELVSRIARIDYTQTNTVLEALVLEASKIRHHQPYYNILAKDDKSFLYLCITNERFPRPLLVRGLDLERMGIQPFRQELSPKAARLFSAVYGPYTSGRSLKTALELVRKAIPWSVCTPPGETVGPELVALAKTQRSFGLRLGRSDGRPCFDAQIGRCPGVCSGAMEARTYGVMMRRLQRVFNGELPKVAKELEKEMVKAAKQEQFEEAARLRNQRHALTHIQDVALIMRDEPLLPTEPAVKGSGYIDLQGRIEAYDIANISGTANVAAMTVFVGGQPLKEAYRKFQIKSFQGADDFSAMEEVIRRRIRRAKTEPKAWPLPEIFIIDGGEGQVGRVKQVLEEEGVTVPVLGIAKGFDRKQDRLVFDRSNLELPRAAESGKQIFQLARDEAHRFAGAYHRVVRARQSGIRGSR